MQWPEPGQALVRWTCWCRRRQPEKPNNPAARYQVTRGFIYHDLWEKTDKSFGEKKQIRHTHTHRDKYIYIHTYAHTHTHTSCARPHLLPKFPPQGAISAIITTTTFRDSSKGASEGVQPTTHLHPWFHPLEQSEILLRSWTYDLFRLCDYGSFFFVFCCLMKKMLTHTCWYSIIFHHLSIFCLFRSGPWKPIWAKRN